MYPFFGGVFYTFFYLTSLAAYTPSTLFPSKNTNKQTKTKNKKTKTKTKKQRKQTNKEKQINKRNRKQKQKQTKMSDLAFYTLYHTRFLTPFSSLVPIFSVILISFTPYLLSLPVFFPVHLTIRVCLCMLSLPICPLWRKAWLFDTLRCNIFFHPCFPLFPPLDVESLPPAFHLFTLFFVTPLHLFWSILLSPCWTVGIDVFCLYLSCLQQTLFQGNNKRATHIRGAWIALPLFKLKNELDWIEYTGFPIPGGYIVYHSYLEKSSIRNDF